MIVSRKYSYNFSDFILGRWSINNYEQIINLFKNMTTYELELLKENDFDQIWRMFWRKEHIKKSYNYIMGHIKYDLIKIGYFINDRYVNLDIISDIFYDSSKKNSTELSFPKGRQDFDLGFKNTIYTGLREFIEETGIEEFIIYDKIKPYVHIIKDNNIFYKTFYYFVEIKDISNVNNFNRDNNEIDKIIIYNKENINKYNFDININEITNKIKTEIDLEYELIQPDEQKIMKKLFDMFNNFIKKEILPHKELTLYIEKRMNYLDIYMDIIQHISNIKIINNKISFYKDLIRNIQREKLMKFNKYKEDRERLFRINFEKEEQELRETYNYNNLARFCDNDLTDSDSDE